MDPAEHVRSLIAYNRWANERVFDVVAQLTSEEAGHGENPHFLTIRGTLGHIAGAQGTWLRRWTDGRAEEARASDTIEALRGEFARLHDELDAFARDFRPEDWDRARVYVDSRGDEQRDTLGTQIVHTVNHGTYHRGELSVLLGEAGRSPGDLDYLIFARKTK